jgi:two-component system, chemotaxis family, chemotaxis protein CheY
VSQKQVMVVEDSADLRTLLQRLLELEGFQVQSAENGEVALRSLHSAGNSLPGLILLDLMMPVMDGPTFLIKMAEASDGKFKNIPVVIISAKIFPPPYAAQIVEVLRKPIDADNLITVVKRLL